MTKRFVFIVVFLSATLIPAPNVQAANPWVIIIREAIKKVVKAVDLLVQRRQNAVIKLQNAQKVLENTMSKLQLDEIADWVKKQRDLYEEYYDELKKVKAVISYYFRIKQIAEKQALITKQYSQAFALFQNDSHFSLDELLYMQKVYAGMLEQTAKTADKLLLVVKSFTTQMTDVKRIQIIENLAAEVDKISDELGTFNNQNKMLSLSRAKSDADAKSIKAIYGLP